MDYKTEGGDMMKAIDIAELITSPFEEACAKIDALTDEEREALVEATANWLVAKLKELIRKRHHGIQSADTNH